MVMTEVNGIRENVEAMMKAMKATRCCSFIFFVHKGFVWSSFLANSVFLAGDEHSQSVVVDSEYFKSSEIIKCFFKASWIFDRGSKP